MNTTFENNSLQGLSQSSLVLSDPTEYTTTPELVTGFRIQGSTFIGQSNETRLPTFLGIGSIDAEVYSDEDKFMVCRIRGECNACGVEATDCDVGDTSPLSEAFDFMTLEDEWLIDTQQVLHRLSISCLMYP